SRAAELYRWVAGQPYGGPALLAVPARVGIGAVDEAREMLSARSGRAPSVLAGAEALLGQGVHGSAAGTPIPPLSLPTPAAARAPRLWWRGSGSARRAGQVSPPGCWPGGAGPARRSSGTRSTCTRCSRSASSWSAPRG